MWMKHVNKTTGGKFPKKLGTIVLFVSLGLMLTLTTARVFAQASLDNDIWWENVYYDSRDSYYRSPLGTTIVKDGVTGDNVDVGESVRFRIRVHENDVESVKLCVWWEPTVPSGLENAYGYAMSEVSSDGENEWWEYTLPAPGVATNLWYHFQLQDGTDYDAYGDDGSRDGGTGQMYEDPDWDIQNKYLLVYSAPAGVASIDGDIWWAPVLHNQDDSSYFSPQGDSGTHPEGPKGRKILYDQDVTLSIRVQESDLKTVWLRVWQENIYQNQVIGGENAPFRLELTEGTLSGNYRFWNVTIPAPGTVCWMWYRFYLVDDSCTEGYSWDSWENPVNPDTDDDIDTYEDHSLRDGGDGEMYDYPQTKNESGEAAAEPTNDFLIIFYEDIAPPAPSLVSPDNNENLTGIPTFEWTSVTDPSPSSGLKYRIQVDNDSDFSSPTVNRETQTNSYTPATLPDGRYYWRAQAFDYDGNSSGWSGVRFFKLDTQPPGVPTPAQPDNGTDLKDTSPTLSWSSVTDASPPVLYRAAVSDDSSFTHENSSSGWIESTEWEVSLSEGLWYWRVQARDNLGKVGENSSIFSFRIDTTPPPAPGLISPENTETNDDTPELQWETVNDLSLPVVYELQLDDDSDFSSILEENTSETNTYVVGQQLSPGRYYWRVRARDNARNRSGWSSAWFVVDPKALTTPTLKSPKEGEIINSRTPTLEWQAVPSSFVVSYGLKVDDSSDFSSPIVSEENLTGTSFQIPTDLSDGKYYWRVWAWTEYKTGDWSQWWFTVDTAAPATPTLYTVFPPKTRIEKWLVTGSAEPGITIKVYVNENSWSGTAGDDGKFSIWITLGTGTNAIKLRAEDGAGNLSENTATQTIERIAGWGHTVELSEVKARTENIFSFEEYDLSLLEIKVKTIYTVFSPIVYVEEFLVSEENELDVPRLQGVKVYRYFVVDSSIPAGELEWADFSFKVELDWLDEKDLSPKDIRLWRFEEEWIPLETSYDGKDATYAYYHLTKGTDKLSWLAIASGPPGLLPTNLLPHILIAVLGVVCAAVGFLVARKRRERKPPVEEFGWEPPSEKPEQEPPAEPPEKREQEKWDNW
jgi:PGF-pre-PGF domain-containing protein